MKKSFVALAVAAGLACFATASFAAIPGSATIGVRGGWVRADMESGANYDRDDKRGYGYGIYADYNFLSWLGVEVGYTVMDGFGWQGKTGYGYNKVGVHGPELALRLAVPLTDEGSDIYLRGGAMYAFGDVDHGDNDDGLAPFVGVGLQWAFNRNFGMRVGYDYYFDAVDGSDSFHGAESDFALAYLGLQFTFGGETPVAPAPAPRYTQINETFALEAGMLFPFDGSVLSEEGKTAVDEVLQKVEEKHVVDTYYTVVGHTDRIGSEAYNQKLSEDRANAVADELMAQGVDPAAMEIRGMGKTSPVTGSECEGLSRSELVKCYAPDRRVEINVTGNVLTETVVEE